MRPDNKTPEDVVDEREKRRAHAARQDAMKLFNDLDALGLDVELQAKRESLHGLPVNDGVAYVVEVNSPDGEDQITAAIDAARERGALTRTGYNSLVFVLGRAS